VFKKGERDNPKINAIMVVKGSLADTDYESYKLQLEDLDKQRQEKEFVIFIIIFNRNKEKFLRKIIYTKILKILKMTLLILILQSREVVLLKPFLV